jgi:zinc transport system permease protein
VFVTRAGDVDIETLPYLFGDPLAVTGTGVAAVICAGLVVAAGAWVLRRVLFAVVTDDEWSRVAGLPVQALNVALAAVTAAIIVAGMRIVGLLLVAALMVLPVASAQLLGRSFRGTVVVAAAIGAASAVVGLGMGIALGISSSGAIVLVAAAVFAGTSVIRRATPSAMEVAA